MMFLVRLLNQLLKKTIILADNSVENHTENNLTVSKPESTIKARQLAESKVKNSNVQTQNGGRAA